MNATGLNALRRNSKQAKEIEDQLSWLQKVMPITNFVRVVETKYATRNTLWTGTRAARLSAGYGQSRFSPVNAGKTKRPKFKVLYGAADLATASYETIIRDWFNLGAARVLIPDDYSDSCAVRFPTQAGRKLCLLDLTGGDAIR